MIGDAKALLNAATVMTGEKAEVVQKRGLRLLNMALSKARAKKELATGNRIAVLADNYVIENPWLAITTAAGLGILVGVILGLNN